MSSRGGKLMKEVTVVRAMSLGQKGWDVICK